MAGEAPTSAKLAERRRRRSLPETSKGFLLALETLGLSSCPLNWPDVPSRERRMARELELGPDERPIMLLAVGYPDAEGAVASSYKKSLNDLRTYNQP